MKKFILMLAMVFAMAFSANAQIATENSKFFDNTYVGVEAGATTPLNFNPTFPLNPVAGIKLGKELTPVFGLEIEGTVLFGDNFNRFGRESSTPAWDEGPINIRQHGSVNTFVKGTNVGLNGVINWSNLLCGYKGTPRLFEVKTNTGLSWLHYIGTYIADRPIGGYKVVSSPNALIAKTAVDFAFNLGNKKAHTITVSPGVYWNLTEEGGVRFNINYAQFGLMVGYAYHFKTSNGTHHFKTYDVGAMTSEIARLNEELAKKPKEVIVEKVVVKEVPATAAVATVNETSSTIFFAFNSDELDDRAKAELDKLGQNGIYVVDAWASSEGSTEYNLKLSQRRADAVKAYLEERGAKVESATGHGVQFGTTTGRVAVIKNK